MSDELLKAIQATATGTKLKKADEVRAKTVSFDLTPILDQIADNIDKASADGLFSTIVSISDSVYALHLSEIVQVLTDNGYVATQKGSSVSIDWSGK